MTFRYLLLLLLISTSNILQAQSLYRCNSGNVKFVSDAELEHIEASSDQLKGIIDAEQDRFAFSVNLKSFAGFNSPLQREHFNENYMESNLYEHAIFEGKIIGDINYVSEGTYHVRAKGIMNIHGVKKEEIITSTVTVRKDVLVAEAEFYVLLSDYDIPIPKVVRRKIAEEIEVQIHAILTK